MQVTPTAATSPHLPLVHHQKDRDTTRLKTALVVWTIFHSAIFLISLALAHHWSKKSYTYDDSGMAKNAPARVWWAVIATTISGSCAALPYVMCPPCKCAHN